MHTDRREFLGIGFHCLSMDTVIDRLSQVTVATPCEYVVTPNVDHIVRLHQSRQSDRKLQPLYDEADLCLCDSKVLNALAKMHRLSLPVVPGSDLTTRVFDRLVRPGDRIAIVGGSDEVVARLKLRFPTVEFVHHAPPMGLRENEEARRAAAQFIARAKARFTFIAVGSPQQEMIAAEAKKIPDATGACLCIGASLNFLTGREKRAPRLVRRFGMEWAHRLATNPRRMWRRYLVEGPQIFILAYRWRENQRAGVTP